MLEKLLQYLTFANGVPIHGKELAKALGISTRELRELKTQALNEGHKVFADNDGYCLVTDYETAQRAKDAAATMTAHGQQEINTALIYIGWAEEFKKPKIKIIYKQERLGL